MDRPSAPQLDNARNSDVGYARMYSKLDGAAHLQRPEKRMQHLKRPLTMALPLQRGADWRGLVLTRSVRAGLMGLLKIFTTEVASQSYRRAFLRCCAGLLTIFSNLFAYCLFVL